jgi:hypothetical protein
VKPGAVIGVILIGIGIIAPGYGEFTYTEREKVLDLDQYKQLPKRNIPFRSRRCLDKFV